MPPNDHKHEHDLLGKTDLKKYGMVPIVGKMKFCCVAEELGVEFERHFSYSSIEKTELDVFK